MAKKKGGSVKAVDDVLVTSASLTADVTGVLPTANGGTGFGAPVVGDLLTGVTGAIWGIKPVGTAGQVLTVKPAVADWDWATPAAAVVDIKTFNRNFGAIPVSEAVFDVADASILIGQQIIVQVPYTGGTGKANDEAEFYNILCSAGQPVPGVGFTVFVRTINGFKELQGNILFNYMVG